MQGELKWKWIEALRSGAYKQGQKQLKKGASYCCLGVLCEVAGLPITSNGVTIDAVLEHAQRASMYPPLERYGLSKEVQGQLTAMNDGSEFLVDPDTPLVVHTFAQIADWIEENIPDV